MNAQRRRVAVATDAGGVGTTRVILTLDETNAVNVHGLHACFSIEPENTDANANGIWAMWCLPGGQIATGGLPDTVAEFNVEDNNPYLWGLGCWTASNQAPFHYDFNPKTTRNCQNQARILMQITKLGVSAGNVRTNMTITCFTS